MSKESFYLVFANAFLDLEAELSDGFGSDLTSAGYVQSEQ